MAEKIQVLRLKPGLLTPINGVAFAAHPEGSISEPIALDVAEVFLAVRGYKVFEDPVAEAQKLAAQKEADRIAQEARDEEARKAKEAADEQARLQKEADEQARIKKEAEDLAAQEAAKQQQGAGDASGDGKAATTKAKGTGKASAAKSDNDQGTF